jgi:CRISPR-associated endonuclease/helicase Cas3
MKAVAIPWSVMNKSAPYYNYWGKADRENPNRFHLLPYHCLDVAAVASVWWEQSSVLRRRFSRLAEGSEETVRAWLLFFVALHDFGKFDIRFQRKADHVGQKLYPYGRDDSLPDLNSSKRYDHGPAGLYWFLRDQKRRFQFDDDFDINTIDIFDNAGVPNDDWQLWKRWLEPVCGHHGYIWREEMVKDWRLPSQVEHRFASSDLDARRKWLEALERLFLHPCGLSLLDNPPSPSPLLAGFCSVADWLGSRSDVDSFVFCSENISLKKYFHEKRRHDAEHVLKLSGIISKTKPFDGIRVLLPAGASPHGVQQIVDDLPDESGLTIVEAPTGSGKTEMALAYAWRLIEKGLAESIIFALPTQATANKMFDRLEPVSVKLFEANPNLLLAHGNARFNESFVAVKQASSESLTEGEAWAQCCQWLSQSRKRAFLGQIGICTVDQVLISVLPVRHRFVRGFGTGRSVVIVDEVHAYDAYMYGLIQQVLKEQRAACGSAILLSATLPMQQRQTLFDAWGLEMDRDSKWDAYPLITWGGMNTQHDYSSIKKEQSGKRVVQIDHRITQDMRPDKALIEAIVTAAESGAQVAIICNLVDDAQMISSHISTCTDLPVVLFHSRFTLKDRMAIEKKVDEYFGKKGDRTIGRILVGTQVLEQSLDYDVDWMITQLCPVDLLFQRMGRLHRHPIRIRPEDFKVPCCTVLSTDTEGYGMHDYVYGNTLVMWRTDKKLADDAHQSVVFPDAYRSWIESIYDEELHGNEPQWVLNGHDKYLEALDLKRFTAHQMIKWSKDTPLADTDQNIQAVTREGEMSFQLVPFVQSSSGKKLIDGRIIEDLSPEKIPEALCLNSINVPRSWERWLDTINQDETAWLQMDEAEDSWIAESKKWSLKYTKTFGLKKSG